MLAIQTVSHCYRYPRLLVRRLSAAMLYPPVACRVECVVFFTAADSFVNRVIAHFAALDWPANVTLRPWPIGTPHLLRRAIGRNMAAKLTTADLVIFDDIDYLYGPGCLDAIAAATAPRITAGEPLFFPRVVQVSADHERGDAVIFSTPFDPPAVVGLPPADHFAPKRMNRAVGGCQWVAGDVARRGYLPNSQRYQKPQERWRRTHEDRVYRASLGGRGTPLDIPGVYRIRHSKRGRFNVGVEL